MPVNRALPLRTPGCYSTIVVALLVVFAATIHDAFGQVNQPVEEIRTVRAIRLTSTIRVDGHLDEAAWNQGPAYGEFRQREPEEGAPASEPTEFRIAYDGGSLYVGIRLWDSQAARIGRQLARRDTSAEADSVAVYLDPYRDRRTGVRLEVSAAGGQTDALIYDDYRTDTQWDAVWDSAVSVDDRGWTAEIRVPLSQLRFAASSDQVWGINVSRYLLRRAEESWLEFIPKDAKWLASRMAPLLGLQEISPGAHLELLPYTLGRASFIAGDPDDPFHSNRASAGDGGLDAKWSPTSYVTLNGTFRPDFGQVEVDPSVINLSAFETFFDEKRPFFLEGSRIFEPDVGSSLFYSRRIGRPPQLSASGDYVDAPDATTILGAVKLTGKVRGWTVGVLNAVTDRTWADTETDGTRGRTEVEPLTNYFVGRARLERPRAGIGATVTATNRDLQSTNAIRRLTESAYAAGADGYRYFGTNGDWKLAGSMQGSWIGGSAEAIARQQRSSRRYFQRPDVTYVTLDETARSLQGWRGQMDLGRQRGTWQIRASVAATSPGFEVNDLGFQSRADTINSTVALGYAKYTTNAWSRRRSLTFTKTDRWNFGSQRQQDTSSLSGSITLRNYWYISASSALERVTLDSQLTRGGPVAAREREQRASVTIGSDSRRMVSFYLGPYWSGREGGYAHGVSSTITVRPARAVSVSLSPDYYRASFAAQYVTTVADELATETYGARYVFSPIRFRQVSMTTRLDLSLTPRLSIQTYVEPFVSIGQYGNPMEFAEPRSFSFRRYGIDAGTLTPDPLGDSVLVDPDGPGAAKPFQLFNFDYNAKSLVTKAVVRWEWRPGSTIYLAWTQQKEDDEFPGSWNLARDTRLMLRAPADDVVLVKIAYWIGR